MALNESSTTFCVLLFGLIERKVNFTVQTFDLQELPNIANAGMS